MYRQHLQLITTEAFSSGDFWVPLDDTVEPGRSYQAVTGVEWTPSPRYQLAVEAYYTDLANLVTVDTELPDDSKATRSEAVFKSGGTGWARGAGGLSTAAHRCAHRDGSATPSLGRGAPSPNSTMASPFPPSTTAATTCLLSPPTRWAHGGSARTWRTPPVRHSHRSPSHLSSAIAPAYSPITASMSALVARSRLRGTDSEFYVQIFNVYSRRNEWFVQLDSVDPEVDPRKIKQLPIIPTLGLNFSF